MVTVANDSGAARLGQQVEVADVGDVVAMDALTTRLLHTVAVGKGIQFRTDVAPGETRRYLLVPRARLAAPPAAKAVTGAAGLKVSVSR